MKPEMRTAVRFPCRRVRATRVVVKPTFRTITAVIEDVSVNGALLRCAKPLTPGGRMSINWTFEPDLKYHRNMLARVVHAEEQVDLSWRVGCEFQAPLDEDDVTMLVGTPG